MIKLSLFRISMWRGFKPTLLRHPLAVAGKFAAILGLFLFATGIVIFIIADIFGGGEAVYIILSILSLQGVVWGIIGVVFLLISGIGKKRLAHLKQYGQRFDAEIINLPPVVGINIGRTPTVYAECIYHNDMQQRCKVKSTMFLWENYKYDKLKAEVYVDWNDPRYYAVEITGRDEYQENVDIDYT